MQTHGSLNRAGQMPVQARALNTGISGLQSRRRHPVCPQNIQIHSNSKLALSQTSRESWLPKRVSFQEGCLNAQIVRNWRFARTQRVAATGTTAGGASTSGAALQLQGVQNRERTVLLRCASGERATLKRLPRPPRPPRHTGRPSGPPGAPCLRDLDPRVVTSTL